MIELLRRAWDRVSLFLPMILMGVLALSTYWLVRSTPGFAPPTPERPPRHEPDYFLRKFSVKTFDATGRVKSNIMGEEARHYPDDDTLEIEQARLRSFDERGFLTTAMGNRAISSADGSQIQLIGNAVIVRDAAIDKSVAKIPPMQLRSEFFHVYVETEQLKTHKPVKLTRGRDEFTADSLEFDNFDLTLLLRGRVRGTLIPGQTR